MSKKILLIDDDQINVKVVKKRLEEAEFEVVIALDGDIGLQEVQKQKPDLIILDVEMPRMNGYTFMNSLKSMPEHKKTPVIVLTAHETMEPIFNLKGVRGYLVKPIKFDLLFEKIEQCLGSNE